MPDGLVRTTVRRGVYVDSVALLQVSSEVLSGAGVIDAALVMGTDLNRRLLRDAGLLDDEGLGAGANDLLIAVRAIDDTVADAAIQHSDELLARRRSGLGAGAGAGAARNLPRSVHSAHRSDPDANLAFVSVPGPYAAGEARQALLEGLHVFLFSDNVSLEDEVALKHLAREKGLLLMGPDCGTSILNGIGLGFANVVRAGRIGLVGASGTGLQEVTSLLHQAGEGISQAIGTGGRDLSTEVGGITTLQAIELLGTDPETDVIVLVGKPPAPDVATRVLQAAAATGKAVIACLLGGAAPDPLAAIPRSNVQIAGTLYEAARQAASPNSNWRLLPREGLLRVFLREGQRQIRGLFCGGTLCTEAKEAVTAPGDHVFIDFGDDRYTQGRAHPMIDPSLRNQAIVEAGSDPRVAVLLLDVILGLGSHADPAGATMPAIREAMRKAHAEGRELAVFAHVVGTDRDPQGLAQQEATLRSAGVLVLESNYHAAVAASVLVGRVAG